MRNLHEIPKFEDKMSYLYVEHAVIDKHERAIAIHDASGKTPVPAAGLATLILGPGTNITHAAIRTLAESNCLVAWCGEHGVRFYAQGFGGSRHSRNLIRQARLVSSEVTRLQVVIRMYCHRFNEPVSPDITLQQLRGKEGIRVREAYAQASRKSGVPWHGRSYKREKWGAADPVNRALSAGNACIYGLVQAAIVSAGYSTALGFIHTGKQLSFVYDIADLYKIEHIIPIAFKVAAKGSDKVERRTRLTCRDVFRTSKLIENILPDIRKVFDIDEGAAEDSDEYADDAARPSSWWEPEKIPSDMPIGEILGIETDTQ